MDLGEDFRIRLREARANAVATANGPRLPPRPVQSVNTKAGATVEFMAFNSMDEMLDFIAKSTEEAQRNLHPLQRALTFNDYWVHFANVADRLVVFGRIIDQPEIIRRELAAGGTPREAARAAVEARVNLEERGYMYGIAYSIWEPEGEWGDTHKANAWPIDESLFNAAAEADWDIDRLPLSARINLEAAYIAIRGHVVGGR